MVEWVNLRNATIDFHEKKVQREYLYKLYIREIKDFFNNTIDRVSFPVDVVVDGKNPVLRFITLEEIPPRLMYRFCEEFGFYSPTVKYHAIGKHGSIREYAFTKKD